MVARLLLLLFLAQTQEKGPLGDDLVSGADSAGYAQSCVAVGRYRDQAALKTAVPHGDEKIALFPFGKQSFGRNGHARHTFIELEGGGDEHFRLEQKTRVGDEQ